MQLTQIAILLNGGIKHDSRVIKICKSLSEIAEVHLYYTNGNSSDQNIFRNENVQLYNIPYPKTIKQKIYRHSLFHKEFDFFLPKLLKKEYDVIYCNDLPTLGIGYQYKRKRNVKLIYDSHEIYLETINQFFLYSSNPFKNSVFKFLISFMKRIGSFYERKYLKYIDEFITVNQSISDYFVKKYSLIRSPHVIMNYPYLFKLDKKKYRDFRSLYDWSRQSIIILYQGNLNSGRGLGLIIELINELPQIYKLLIIGDGILKNQLKDRAKELGLTNRVKFLGRIDNDKLLDYTTNSDIGFNLLESLNKSKEMASPNKLFEYIQAEIPSINTDTVENRKILNTYNNGWLVNNSIVEIAELLSSISEKDIDRIKTNCKQAKIELSWENQQNKLLSIIKK